MRYPRSIRLPRDHYANRELRFHLTIHAHAKFHAWPAELRQAIWASVLEQRTAGRVELFAACLMPDHLHLLVRPDQFDIIHFVDAWKSWTTRRAWPLGVRGALWQPGMWDRTIRDERDFEYVTAYILRNPVEAGLVTAKEEWPWSWAWYHNDHRGGDGPTD